MPGFADGDAEFGRADSVSAPIQDFPAPGPKGSNPQPHFVRLFAPCFAESSASPRVYPVRPLKGLPQAAGIREFPVVADRPDFPIALNEETSHNRLRLRR